MNSAEDRFDLIIVGCGPVGALAANLAARAGLRTIVLERATDIVDVPRAIHFDGHIMRILQQAGVAHDMSANTRVWKRSTYYGADGEPIRVHEWPPDRPLGWDAHYLFYQPQFEHLLRSQFDSIDQLTIRLGFEAVAVRQDAESATVTAREVDTGRLIELAASYVLGCDGASSFVRTTSASSLVDENFDEQWLVIDLLTDAQLGSPGESEMFCDPRRPATRVPGPGAHHRWEFMLLPGETPEQIQRTESINELLRPWVRPESVELVRNSVYRFHALVADRWRDHRTFLVGDAAHQTPPFFGQGLCHGIRDAQNLIWKLAATLHDGAPLSLLDTYQAERRPHVLEIIRMAVAAGKDICLLDPQAAAQRDIRMRLENEHGREPKTTFEGMPPLRAGLIAEDCAELFPQPLVRTAGAPDALMDDVVGPGAAVVALESALAEEPDLTGGHSVPVIAVGNDAPYGLPAVSGELKTWFDERDACAAVLRPDRYVYALCRKGSAVAPALASLHSAMHS